MAANTSPIFTLTPNVSTVQISTANTNRDGTGTLGTVLTGATNGTRIDFIQIKAAVSTTGGMIRFYIDNGTNVRLWKEVLVSAVTASSTVAAFETEVVRTDNKGLLILPNGYILKVSSEKGETFNIIAFGGDY